MDPLVDATGHPYAYAGDNPANNTDPSGQDFCNGSTPIFGHACQAAGAAHNAVNDAAKSVLRHAVIGLNDAITSFAQSDFSNGVNDAVIAFALSIQNLPKSVHTLITGVLAHPERAITLLKSLLLTVAESLGPLQMLQVAKSLGELLLNLKAEVDCKGLGYTAGYALTSFILKFALADATGGLGRLASEALAEGVASGRLAGGGSPCGLCFPAGTLVATLAGEKPIEQLHTGDTVLAEDPKTGKVEAERVVATIVHPASELAQVNLSDGSGVTVTADHPFYVDASAVRKQAGWVQAGDLRVGDRLRNASGRDVGVTGVRYNVGRAVVYTLSVATDHTFFVGAAQVLVHNTNCSEQIARWMAGGHSWDEHMADFPWIRNRDDFAHFLENIIEHPGAEKNLSNGRKAYWDYKSETVVIVNPHDPDLGTAFRPHDGKSYFDRL